MKTVKKISFLIAILSSSIVLNACSSGGSDGAGALDLTGRWDGAGTFFNQDARFMQGTMTLAQDRPTAFEGSQDVRGSMALEGSSCVFTFSFTGQVNGRTNTISIESDDEELSFVATANNREIVGNLTILPSGGEGGCDGPFVAGPTRWTRVR